MSFSFRDRGRLSDRLRGKTCDEILKELRDQLHQDRNMSFDSTPWGSFSGPGFSRTGFPFMDQDIMGRPEMRARFEDIASRHPEFADHLRPGAWGSVPKTDPHFFYPPGTGPEPHRQRNTSGSSSSGSGVFTEDSIPIPVIHEDSGGGDSSRSRTRKIPQYGLRNTVDLGESQKVNPTENTDGEARSQRSWSAPPDNRGQGEAPQPKRFVTRVDVNNAQGNVPANGTDDSSSTSGVSSPGKPPPFPKSSGSTSPQAQQQASKQSNVRHIPIFVEGRDEPVVSKTRDGHAFASAHSSSGFGQPNFSYSYAQAPPGAHSSAFASSHASSPSAANRSHQPNPPPTHGHKTPQQPSNPPDQKESIPPKQPPKPAIPKDPIAKVQAVQAEVDELKKYVDNFSGTRNDKQYIYLDEMLTRNLIKLDDIETEGKETIRLARKEAIRSIQKCISELESKAGLPQNVQQPDESSDADQDMVAQEDGHAESAMDEASQNEQENIKESTPVSEEMEVDKTENIAEKPSSSDAGSIVQEPLSDKQMEVLENGEESVKSTNSVETGASLGEEKMEVISEQSDDVPAELRRSEQPEKEVPAKPENEGFVEDQGDSGNAKSDDMVETVDIKTDATTSTAKVASSANEQSCTKGTGDSSAVKDEDGKQEVTISEGCEAVVPSSIEAGMTENSNSGDPSSEKCDESVQSKQGVNTADDSSSTKPPDSDEQQMVPSS